MQVFCQKTFFEKPQRPHPNCKCKIQRILPKKTAQKALIKNTPIVTDLLRGDTSPLFLFFSATSVINVHIKNFFIGIRPVVLGLIASSCIAVIDSDFYTIYSIVTFGIIFYLTTYKNLHPIVAIFLTGIIGMWIV